MNNKNLILTIGVGIGIGIGVGISICGFNIMDIISENNNKNHAKSNYNKMYNIIETTGGLDTDLYGRKINSNVVNSFCEIAQKYSIDLDNITNDEFDFIYRTYTENQIQLHNSKKK